MANTDSLNRTLFIGDNLPILRGIDSESIDLIATDPPFNKGVKAFEGVVTAGTDKQGKEVSYKDVWTWGDVQADWTESIRQDHPNLYAVIQGANAGGGEDMGAFLCWLAVRVLAMHRILKPTGSIYLHIDHTAHAYAKAMMDAIFGRGNFQNEIVWYYGGGGASKQRFGRKHDTILFYSKSNKWTFNLDDVRVPHKWVDGQLRADGSNRSEKGKIPDDVIELHGVMPWAGERTGYPTQKPLALYQRIIKASSNEGDLVLDPFAGCATTCVAAEGLDRKWIGIDLNKEAKQVMFDRLQREVQKSMAWGKEVKTPLCPPYTTGRNVPKRTDDGEAAAPELVLVSPKPKGPRMTVRELRERLSIEDGAMCLGCGYIPPKNILEYLEVDHRMPKSKGGKDDLRNRVLLCSPCNGTKGNKLTLAELRLKRIQEGRMLNPAWTMKWYEDTGKFG